MSILTRGIYGYPNTMAALYVPLNRGHTNIATLYHALAHTPSHNSPKRNPLIQVHRQNSRPTTDSNHYYYTHIAIQRRSNTNRGIHVSTLNQIVVLRTLVLARHHRRLTIYPPTSTLTKTAKAPSKTTKATTKRNLYGALLSYVIVRYPVYRVVANDS